MSEPAVTTSADSLRYAGFWIRGAAAFIDTLLLFLITMPILYSIYGDQYFNPDKLISGFWDVLISWVLPAIAVIAFWLYRSATPGKMILKLKIVDAETGEVPTRKQFIIRYLGYYLAGIPMFTGFLWAAFDKRKQGWHDKLAKTVVIRA